MRSMSLMSLAAVSFAATAAAGPEQSGALNVPANTIVGLWSTEAVVGFCGQAPTTPIRNTLLFHAGGTVVENPRSPPSGVPNVGGIPGIYQRGQALGTWTFNPAQKSYEVHLRFDNYVDGVYHGYSTVDRQISLLDGFLAYGPVTSSRYLADGTLLVAFCGEATSTRL